MRPAISLGLEVLAKTQHPTGSWKGDYGGPLFLLPVYVFGLEMMGRSPEPEVRDGFIQHLRVHQNKDGGWGLDIESPSLVFTSVLNYVAMRLMGVAEDDPALKRARAWFLPYGGGLASASWGKFFLAMLGLYEYDGLQPLPPELWILPKSLPIHASRMWCHARMVYLPMSWMYGKRVRAKERPLLAAIRSEIYGEPYATIDWAAARDRVAVTDAYTPHSWVLQLAHPVMNAYEKLAPKAIRERALDEALFQIHGEDEATHFVCIGPINKVLNMVVRHLEDPDGPAVKAHLERLPEYLFRAKDGVKVNGYNSSELWDTTFAVQAIAATGQAESCRPMLAEAARFIEANQLIEEVPDRERIYRHQSKGGWPFSTRAHSWPIADCTAEGLKASLALEKLGLNQVSSARLEEAVEVILSLQNRDGGWATYELQRSPAWLELFNPSDVFGGIMVDYSYVECTSSCVQALAAWQQQGTGKRSAEIDEAIRSGVAFIRRTQREDGGWEGSWGVCFTYGTWFGVTGLVAGGVQPGDPALKRAAAFLAAHQREDGAWSETIESCRRRTWVEGETGHAVNTSWALLALAAAGEKSSRTAKKGLAWLRARQGPDGRWPEEPIAGVFNKSCAIHYDAYLRVFPVWALGVYGES